MRVTSASLPSTATNVNVGGASRQRRRGVLRLAERQLRWFSSGLCGWFPVLVALEGSLAGDAEVTTDEGPVGSVAAESEYVFLLALGKEFA